MKLRSQPKDGDDSSTPRLTLQEKGPIKKALLKKGHPKFNEAHLGVTKGGKLSFLLDIVQTGVKHFGKHPVALHFDRFLVFCHGSHGLDDGALCLAESEADAQSVLGSLFIIVSYCIFPHSRKFSRRLLLFLTIADLGASLGWLMSGFQPGSEEYLFSSPDPGFGCLWKYMIQSGITPKDFAPDYNVTNRTCAQSLCQANSQCLDQHLQSQPIHPLLPHSLLSSLFHCCLN